ncbi:MAG: 50S ribosomal protein L24 [Clostridia bacterium]|nr:50S ribosomal protein L24 [Clostridia bacterium]
MKIKKNDTVLVITGKDKNNDLEKASKVIAVLPKENKVVVEGVNLQKKHKKARSAQEVSSIQTQPGPIDASNVMVVCPTCKKATRVGYRVEGDKKVRICKKCNAVLDGVKAKEVKKTTKRKTKKDAAETPAEA